ncbi:hypothetical protein HELRODRAFT_178761 [Helobdella robusta]|uniref:Uncharacterized protein n=1 Tax=Helobdella robusta TaxID=6412 RepID=T1FDP4_HELRO|nr:hypothetical protein HELRODRAFT_178761 [Helobdella robusta]ESN96958.1 hypothetical protein HELRODRAFT_178761 [Helobdella robusta]
MYLMQNRDSQSQDSQLKHDHQLQQDTLQQQQRSLLNSNQQQLYQHSQQQQQSHQQLQTQLQPQPHCKSSPLRTMSNNRTPTDKQTSQAIKSSVESPSALLTQPKRKIQKLDCVHPVSSVAKTLSSLSVVKLFDRSCEKLSKKIRKTKVIKSPKSPPYSQNHCSVNSAEYFDCCQSGYMKPANFVGSKVAHDSCQNDVVSVASSNNHCSAQMIVLKPTFQTFHNSQNIANALDIKSSVNSVVDSSSSSNNNNNNNVTNITSTSSEYFEYLNNPGYAKFFAKEMSLKKAGPASERLRQMASKYHNRATSDEGYYSADYFDSNNFEITSYSSGCEKGKENKLKYQLESQCTVEEDHKMERDGDCLGRNINPNFETSSHIYEPFNNKPTSSSSSSSSSTTTSTLLPSLTASSSSSSSFSSSAAPTSSTVTTTTTTTTTFQQSSKDTLNKPVIITSPLSNYHNYKSYNPCYDSIKTPFDHPYYYNAYAYVPADTQNYYYQYYQNYYQHYSNNVVQKPQDEWVSMETPYVEYGDCTTSAHFTSSFSTLQDSFNSNLRHDLEPSQHKDSSLMTVSSNNYSTDCGYVDQQVVYNMQQQQQQQPFNAHHWFDAENYQYFDAPLTSNGSRSKQQLCTGVDSDNVSNNLSSSGLNGEIITDYSGEHGKVVNKDNSHKVNVRNNGMVPINNQIQSIKSELIETTDCMNSVSSHSLAHKTSNMMQSASIHSSANAFRVEGWKCGPEFPVNRDHYLKHSQQHELDAVEILQQPQQHHKLFQSTYSSIDTLLSTGSTMTYQTSPSSLTSLTSTLTTLTTTSTSTKVPTSTTTSNPPVKLPPPYLSPKSKQRVCAVVNPSIVNKLYVETATATFGSCSSFHSVKNSNEGGHKMASNNDESNAKKINYSVTDVKNMTHVRNKDYNFMESQTLISNATVDNSNNTTSNKNTDYFYKTSPMLYKKDLKTDVSTFHNEKRYCQASRDEIHDIKLVE